MPNSFCFRAWSPEGKHENNFILGSKHPSGSLIPPRTVNSMSFEITLGLYVYLFFLDVLFPRVCVWVDACWERVWLGAAHLWEDLPVLALFSVPPALIPTLQLSDIKLTASPEFRLLHFTSELRYRSTRTPSTSHCPVICWHFWCTDLPYFLLAQELTMFLYFIT